jgi:hypothetical protein
MDSQLCSTYSIEEISKKRKKSLINFTKQPKEAAQDGCPEMK